MAIARRTLLIAGAAALVPVAPLLREGRVGFVADLIAAQFGAAIAEHPETEKFLDAFDASWRAGAARWSRYAEDAYFNYEIDRLELRGDSDEALERQAIFAFLTSTNVIRALAGKETFAFAGDLFDPYGTPCTNRLATVG